MPENEQPVKVHAPNRPQPAVGSFLKSMKSESVVKIVEELSDSWRVVIVSPGPRRTSGSRGVTMRLRKALAPRWVPVEPFKPTEPKAGQVWRRRDTGVTVSLVRELIDPTYNWTTLWGAEVLDLGELDSPLKAGDKTQVVDVGVDPQWEHLSPEEERRWSAGDYKAAAASIRKSLVKAQALREYLGMEIDKLHHAKADPPAQEGKCPACLGTGMVAGALGVGMTWPCRECS